MPDEINLISDDDLRAPLILLERLEKIPPVLDEIINLSLKHEKSIASATSTNKLKKETAELADEQKRLATVQSTVATEITKNTKQYTDLGKQIGNVKNTLKDIGTASKKQTNDTAALNSAVTLLTTTLKKNQAQYALLKTEEERSSKVAKELLTTIQQQDQELKKLNGEIAKNEFDDLTVTISSLKDELKAAKNEMVEMADKLGEDSDEFKNASVKAGELSNKISSINDVVKASSGDTGIQNMASRFGLLGDKLKNLDFKGANTQIREIAKLSKGMTFKEATAGLGQFTKGIFTLGRALLTNPLFLLAALIVGIVVAVVMLRDKIKPLQLAFEYLGKGIDYIVQKGKDFLDWLNLTSFAIDEKAQKTIEAAKKERDALAKRYDDEIKLANAAGKNTLDLEKKKQEAIASTTQEAINAYSERLAQGGSKLTEDELKDLEELKEAYRDAQLELQIIALNKAKFEKEQREKKRAEEIAFQKELSEMAKKAADDILRNIEAKDDEYLSAHKKRVIETLASDKLGEQERRKILFDSQNIIEGHRKASTKRLIDDEIKAIEAAMPFIEMDATAKAEALQRIHELKTKLSDLEYETFVENQDKQLLATQNYISKVSEMYNGFTSSIGSLFSSITDSRLMEIDKEQKALEKSLNVQLQMAGDNEVAKSELKNEFDLKQQELDKKRIQQQRKAAIFDKATSAIQAAINTALAITNQLAKGDPYTAIPRSIAAGVIGGLQVAAILAKPIPQYEEGTKGIPHKGGPAIVGEAGTEMVVLGGRLFSTPNKPTLVDLPAGAEVIPNHELGALALKNLGLSDTISSNPESDLMFLMGKKMDSLEYTIKSKKEFHVNFSRKGAEAAIRNQESLIKFMNEFYF